MEIISKTKYTYLFAADKKFKKKFKEAGIEISGEWAAVLKKLDDKERSNDKKETRRHFSLNKLLDLGFKVRDYSQDLDFVLDCNEYYKKEELRERLQKQVFNKFLTEKQADIFYEFKILKYRKVKIAKKLNITEGAVRKHIIKAEERMEESAARVSRVHGCRKDFVYDDETLYEGISFLKIFLRLKN